jgi:hypothetical protein
MTPVHKVRWVEEGSTWTEWWRIYGGRLRIYDDINWSGGGGECEASGGGGVCETSG